MNNEGFKILLADDEPDILEFIGYNLKKEGFEIYTANNGINAIKMAAKVLPHLIIMDVMMPGMDGFEACREIKKLPALTDTLIIFLTARSEDYSQISGFDSGADDYVTKPIQPRVLVSRIKALLRRHRTFNSINKAQIKLPNIIIDNDRYMVIINNKELSLPKKEFELLHLLASCPNKIFSRNEIFRHIWGSDVVVGDRTIDVHVRKIREKIGLKRITTIKGVGYKFESVPAK